MAYRWQVLLYYMIRFLFRFPALGQGAPLCLTPSELTSYTGIHFKQKFKKKTLIMYRLLIVCSGLYN